MHSFSPRLVCHAAYTVLLVCTVSRLVVAQSPSEMVTGPSRATQLPLSGNSSQTGSVRVQQSTANAGSNNSVDVIDSSVVVQGPYLGSVLNSPTAEGTLSLTLESALAMGLRDNLGAISQSTAVQQANGQRLVARSELLPQLNTAISEVFERANLRTQGVEVATFPSAVKFNYYDARAARLNQAVFDLVKIRNLQSATANLKASIQAARNARDLIVLAVGGSYLKLLQTEARLQATNAQVETSRTIYRQASDQFSAGVVNRVDVARSQVQLQTEEQRARSLRGDVETQKLQFARLIGLAPGQQFVITGDYRYAPQADFTVDSALNRAFLKRTDLQAAAAGLRAAEAGVKAAHAEHVPSLNINADFGAAGVTPTHESTGVYTVSGTLTIPLYEGGRIHGDVEQASAALRQRKAEVEDLRGQIDEDVREAFVALNTADDQVDLAASNVTLSHETLTQSEDRFVAGVTDTVELVQAQQAVVQADDDYITAVFEHNLAKVALARAMGDAEQTLPQLLRK